MARITMFSAHALLFTFFPWQKFLHAKHAGLEYTFTLAIIDAHHWLLRSLSY